MKKVFGSKGMSIIEVILAIGLVSIIMVQVLNLLVDVKNEQALGESKTKDLSNRSIIMQRIEKDFVSKNIVALERCRNQVMNLDDYKTKSCLKVSYENDTNNPYFLITAVGRKSYNNKYDFFIYGYRKNGSAEKPKIYEAWKLESGTYPAGGADGCEYELKGFYCDTDLNGHCNSNYFILRYPVLVSDSMSNTSMNFDLEFIYYFRKGAPLPGGFEKVGDPSYPTDFWNNHNRLCK